MTPFIRSVSSQTFQLSLIQMFFRSYVTASMSNFVVIITCKMCKPQHSYSYRLQDVRVIATGRGPLETEKIKFMLESSLIRTVLKRCSNPGDMYIRSVTVTYSRQLQLG